MKEKEEDGKRKIYTCEFETVIFMNDELAPTW